MRAASVAVLAGRNAETVPIAPHSSQQVYASGLKSSGSTNWLLLHIGQCICLPSNWLNVVMGLPVFADLTAFDFALAVVCGYFLVVFVVLSLIPGASTQKFGESD